MNSDLRKIGAVGVLAVVLFGVGFSVARQYRLNVDLSQREVEKYQYRPEYVRQPGRQIELVFVGSSACAWSTRDSLVASVRIMKRNLAEWSEARGLGFKAIGIAIDWSVPAGSAFLERFGLFDEVSIGYNWGNSLALKYLWDTPNVRAATPRLLIYERYNEAPSDSTDALDFGERERRLLAVGRGYRSIINWGQTGSWSDILERSVSNPN